LIEFLEHFVFVYHFVSSFIYLFRECENIDKLKLFFDIVMY